jgi:Raf kinase inhibitor-like YbhB/YbcL family protein
MCIVKRITRFSCVPLVLTLLLEIGIVGCEAGTRRSQSETKPEGAPPMKIQITSTAFSQGQRISKKYSGEGEDLSPPLAWTGVPEGTKELALICDDPDAPTDEPWVHWVIYKIPADAKGLPEGVAKTAQLQEPPGAVQGKNSWPSGQTVGYRGPMPPPKHGPHRYFFKLYALDAKLTLAAGASKQQLLGATAGHVIGEGELMGTYERR